MTLNTQTFIHINTNYNSSPSENQSVLVCPFIRTVHNDSLKAHITKHMNQGSCMLEPPMVSYVE